MRLKTNKTFIKGQTKIKNQNNKDQIEKDNIYQIEIEWWNWKQIKFI